MVDEASLNQRKRREGRSYKRDKISMQYILPLSFDHSSVLRNMRQLGPGSISRED